MNIGKAWPWAISFCIHAIVLYFLLSQSIKITQPQKENSAIVQAYVTVNLTSHPKSNSVATTTNAPDIKPVDTKSDTSNTATSNTTPIKTGATKAKVKEAKNTQAKRTTLPKTQTGLKNNSAEPLKSQPAAPAKSSSAPSSKSPQTFKKLNPYAPVFGSPINNMTHKK